MEDACRGCLKETWPHFASELKDDKEKIECLRKQNEKLLQDNERMHKSHSDCESLRQENERLRLKIEELKLNRQM